MLTKRGRGGEDEEITRMGPGQVFGEMALIDERPRSATAEAVERPDLIRLNREDFEGVLASDINLGMMVYRTLARNLSRRLRQTTDDLTFVREVARRRRG